MRLTGGCFIPSGNGATWGGPLWEATAALGPVLIDAAGGGGVFQHGAPLTRMFSKLDPTGTAGRRVYLYGQAQRCGLFFKHGWLIPNQPKYEGTPAAHAPALVHADIGGCFRCESEHWTIAST